ncbi:DUF2085 domain-containing protein [candidate division WOR-3 bacterium]|nr:DUF2085 domain-containing protein [candidate division WOR-3 bacterium]
MQGKKIKFFDPDKKKYPLWSLIFGLAPLVVWFLGVAPAFLDMHNLFSISYKIKVLYKVFCHGIPDRCPHFFGYPAVVCFRCTGIDLGFFFSGSILYPALRRFVNPEAWYVHLAFISITSWLIFLEWLGEFLGLITSLEPVRLVSGLLFSISVSIFLFFVAENVIQSYWD